MASEVDQVDQASQHLQEENERQGMGVGIRTKIKQLLPNLKQLKSFEILKSALTIFTSNTKFMLLVILSIIPYFAFMVFFEIKLQKAIDALPYFLKDRSSLYLIYYDSPDPFQAFYDDKTKKVKEFLSCVIHLCLFYLTLYPVLEIFSMIITMKVAAKAHTGDKEATLKEVLFQKNYSLKGLSVTCLCVHLLSTLTMVGLIWIVMNCRTVTGFTGNFNPFGYNVTLIEVFVFIICIVLHSAFFIALLYKYFEWSAFWNMGMVISILGQETGIGAFGMADWYGKHCKQTGFQLMLILFTFGNVLRLPCLIAGLCNGNLGGVFVAAIAIGMVCLGNLVKWVAFVLYFYYCKQQILEKKADVEVGKAKNAGAV